MGAANKRAIMYVRRKPWPSIRQQAKRCLSHIHHHRHMLTAVIEDSADDGAGLLDAIQMVNEGRADVIVVAELGVLPCIEVAGDGGPKRPTRLLVWASLNWPSLDPVIEQAIDRLT